MATEPRGITVTPAQTRHDPSTLASSWRLAARPAGTLPSPCIGTPSPGSARRRRVTGGVNRPYLVDVRQQGGDVASQPGAGLAEQLHAERVAVARRARQVLAQRREPMLLELGVRVRQQTEPGQRTDGQGYASV